jgi:hypothetical protein
MTLSISRIYRLSVLEVAHDRVMYVCSQRSEYACVYVSVCVYFMRFEKNTICMLEINIYQTSPNSTFHTHTHTHIYIYNVLHVGNGEYVRPVSARFISNFSHIILFHLPTKHYSTDQPNMLALNCCFYNKLSWCCCWINWALGHLVSINLKN